MKDAYYFPHYCNARHDRKIQRVRKELGVEGYGIFFMLLEVLRDQTDFMFPMEDIDLLAQEFGTSEQKVRTVICNYQLFEVDTDQKFFSPKLLVYLQPYFNMKDQRKLAANIRWDKEKNKKDDAGALRLQSGSNAKESKVKESKVKESKGEYGSLNNVLLTVKEYDLLVTEYGTEKVNYYIESLSLYHKMNIYKDHNKTIRAWMHRDKIKKLSENKQPIPKYTLPPRLQAIADAKPFWMEDEK